MLARPWIPALATSSAALPVLLAKETAGCRGDEAPSAPRLMSVRRFAGPAESGKGLATRRSRSGNESGLQPRQDWWDARSRTRLATRTPLYDIGLAVERIAAAAQAARALSSLYADCASTQFLYAESDLDDTISRLQAFEKAGPTCFRARPA